MEEGKRRNGFLRETATNKKIKNKSPLQQHPHPTEVLQIVIQELHEIQWDWDASGRMDSSADDP